MDALSRPMMMSRVLFAQGKWSIAGGVLATIAAVWSALVGTADTRSMHEILSAVALSCWLGRAAQYMPALAIWAGHLGIPSHHVRIRNAQAVLLAASLAFCVGLELQFAADLRAVAAPLVIVAVVVSMAILPGVSMAVLGTLIIGNTISRKLMPLLFEPLGATMLMGISVFLIVHWFRKMRQLERQAAGASYRLSDAAHEEVHAEDIDHAHVSLESNLDSAFVVQPGRVSARRFWLGMSYDAINSWKAVGQSLLVAIAASTAAHFYFAGRADWKVYLLGSAITAITLFGRLNALHAAWLRTPQEQAILMLTQRWPQGRALKIEFLRSLWTGFPGYAAFWAVFSMFVLMTNWVDLRTVLMAGAGLLIITACTVALLMFYLTQRRVSKSSVFAICFALLVLVGLFVLAGGWLEASPGAVLIGLALIFLPTLPAVYLFCARRLQFPVQPPPS